MRNKINLLGMRDAKKFYEIVCGLKDANVFLSDGRGSKVNAKSWLGCVLAISEWENIYIESDLDCYSAVEAFIEVAENDGNYIHR